MFTCNGPRDLYQYFRDGLLSDAIRLSGHSFDPWKVIPKGAHIGRLQTDALTRKMIKRLQKQFPGGTTWEKGKLRLSAELLTFAKTHWELGSTEDEAVEAWKAMRAME